MPINTLTQLELLHDFQQGKKVRPTLGAPDVQHCPQCAKLFWAF